jgi:hypothetical protein
VTARVYRAVSLAIAPVAAWFSIEVLLRAAVGDVRGSAVALGYLALAGATLSAARWRQTSR